MKRPIITVKKYMPSCPNMTSQLSISNIFDATKNMTPTGDNLKRNPHSVLSLEKKYVRTYVEIE